MSAERKKYQITPKQIVKIKILAKKAFRDDEDYRDCLEANFGVRSCKNLSSIEAGAFIRNLEATERTSSPNTRTPSVLPGGGSSFYGKGSRGTQRHLTAAQAERIEILRNMLGWSESGLYKFVERQTGKSKGIQMLTNYEAVKVIVGMQRVIAKGDEEFYKKLNDAGNLELVISH